MDLVGSPVLAVVWVFHAEFPAVEQLWSIPVALLVLVQMFPTGAAVILTADAEAISIATARVLYIFI